MPQRLLAAVLVVGLAPTLATAQISYGTAGSLYSQNFDSLVNDGTNPFPWTNNSTLAGWFLFRQNAANPPVAITQYSYGNGNSNAGSFYSFGESLQTDRALGGVGSGAGYFGAPAGNSVAGWFAIGVTNTTASAINDVNVLYDGEQWRNGGPNPAVAQTMVMEWGLGATFDAVTTWNAPGAAFNFASPVFSTTASGLNGNDPANRLADRGGDISGVAWGAGQTLWFRWIEFNDPSNDHGLAVDNFRFTTAPVPEPTTPALCGAGLVAFVALRRRKAHS